MSDKQCWLLDYGAGNVRSVENAISSLGFQVHHVRTVADLAVATRVVFPGVGVFGEAVLRLRAMGLWDALIEYVRSNRPFLGICVGMQLLFEEGEESPGVRGLGIIPGRVDRFQVAEQHLSVPHIGWNGINTAVDQASASDALCSSSDVFYFVHSYRAIPTELNRDWIGAVTDYGDKFISMVHRGAIFATQFHPEKSGRTGLRFLDRFLNLPLIASPNADVALLRTDSAFQAQLKATTTLLRKRIIACLDVRMNDAGDVVVTKGDQYDVRERDGANAVRNLGAPVALAERYYNEGADEVTFLNITGFRDDPTAPDSPMRAVLERASAGVFVPLTIGGGVRDFVSADGTRTVSALQVASAYFRSGADKVSLGSDAVSASEAYYAAGCVPSGTSAVEQISTVYGRQAVVISVDPRRVYVSDASEASQYRCVALREGNRGPNGESLCWYQCTVKGGREGRPLDVFQLAKACEALGAGELLVNSIDADGSKRGFDVDLLGALSSSCGLPVIASSGAGCVEHFSSVFRETRCEAALAAGIFHRNEVSIGDVKAHLKASDIVARD